MTRRKLDAEQAADAVRLAIDHLKAARGLFLAAGAGKVAARVRAAISSAKGARRNADNKALLARADAERATMGVRS